METLFRQSFYLLQHDKTRDKGGYIHKGVGVMRDRKPKLEDQKSGTLWVKRGKGIPKEWDEEKR